MKVQRLQPEAFTYGKYNADIPYKILYDHNLLFQWCKEHIIIGYSKTTEIRPRPEEVAVMFDLEDHGEHWNHIPQEVFNRLLAA